MTKHQAVPETIFNCIISRAHQQPDASALSAVTGNPLTYRQLAQQIQQHHIHLRAISIHQSSVVAVVLPNGPVLAAAFLSVSSSAACAPLNPRYTKEEFLFFLKDLQADLLVTDENFAPQACSAARELSIPVLEITHPEEAPAGTFLFPGCSRSHRSTLTAPDPAATALLLHTSGTTSRPKMVPLSHANLARSARNIAQSLELNERDICLNIMPLFHVHGLIGAVLSSLAAGAQVCCTPGFLVPRFLSWLHTIQPTWWTAVPTMQQALLERASSLSEPPVHNLRFIRSCSAPMPPVVLQALENLFKVPVIEAYGMTEASHQISINPLPPLAHKPGSVGLPTGTDIQIADSAGNFLHQGDIGEIVIQGQTITSGYLNNPSANEKSFFDGWFRTGDEGFLDEDGYLFLTSRIKEIINRGGEKITPQEVDQALLTHPEILEALCFAIPHTSLGEDTAAVIVLRQGSTLTEREIRRHVGSLLADFKVPSMILFRDDIPKGPTGKPQRIGLAERLQITPAGGTQTSTAPYEPPGSAAEKLLHDLWSTVLEQESISISAPFTALGGDSILAMILVGKVQETFDVELSLIDFFDTATIREQASLIERLAARSENNG